MINRKQRRLADLVAAEVVSCSRLMCVDEVGALANLRAHRAALMDPLIKTHGGGVVKTMGDGLSRELPAAVNAT
jgi:class 3 adenylate cyclase